MYMKIINTKTDDFNIESYTILNGELNDSW